MGDAATHCPHAGSDGGGVCVAAVATACDTYCAAALANCTGDNELYADNAGCLCACAGWASDPGYTPGSGGDSVECRTYHAGDPAMGDAALHCPHAGPDGGGVCVTAATPTDHAVTISGFAFAPDSLSIAVGDTVTWTNDDAVNHSSTSDDDAWDTGLIASGTSATVTFDTAGTFAYHCTPHPNMTATVTVE